jgi:threonine dehydrogenase-like Zn-dependent dehydrogenase
MVYRLRDDRPAEELRTFFEPLSCAVTWVHPIREGDVVVIRRSRAMGMATIVARGGAETIIVTGVSQDRFRLDTARCASVPITIDVERRTVEARRRHHRGGWPTS